MKSKLIWVRYNGRMSPQLWEHDAPGNPGRLTIAAEHKLGAEDCALSFDELIAKYPAPTHVGEVLAPEMPLPKLLMPKTEM